MSALFEVVVNGAGGERQNVCEGYGFRTREEADRALEALVEDGLVDAEGPYAAYVAEVQSP